MSICLDTLREAAQNARLGTNGGCILAPPGWDFSGESDKGLIERAEDKDTAHLWAWKITDTGRGYLAGASV